MYETSTISNFLFIGKPTNLWDALQEKYSSGRHRPLGYKYYLYRKPNSNRIKTIIIFCWVELTLKLQLNIKDIIKLLFLKLLHVRYQKIFCKSYWKNKTI